MFKLIESHEMCKDCVYVDLKPEYIGIDHEVNCKYYTRCERAYKKGQEKGKVVLGEVIEFIKANDKGES